MRLLPAILLLLLGLLVSADYLLQESRRQDRRTTGSLRSFANLSADQVRSFQIKFNKTTHRYVRRDSTWRYPAYFDAFADPGRVDQFLGSLLQSAATVVATNPARQAHFGLQPEAAIEVVLQGPADTVLLEALIGRGAPGRGASEAYVKKAGNDTLLHLHANPRLALASGNPPMLDRRVLPTALRRKSLRRITFVNASGLRQLRRIETALHGFPLPGRMPTGPTYVWLATFAAREDTCLNASAFAYASFLSRLRYEELHDPHNAKGFESSSARLELTYEDDVVDVLEVGGRSDKGHIYLHHHTSGQILTISAAKADLLFPTRSTLLDSLPQPSPYQQTEPFGPAPF